MFAIAVLTLTWGGASHALRPPDRSALLAALDQRVLTGLPKHLDHDEGQDLQEAVTVALAANPNDADVARAAVRASFLVVPHVSPVISDAMPSIAVDMLQPFKLPWKITADAVIDASVDGSAWRQAKTFAPNAMGMIPIDELFPRASRQGFHVVRLRASLSFHGGPAFLPPSDTRELPPVMYGIAGTSAAGQRVTALLNSAGRASVSGLDRSLPRVPLGAWLPTVAATPGSPPIEWTGLWCEDRPGLDDELPASICARSIVGVSPEGGHAEIWVKIATVDTSGLKPTLTAITPTLEAVDLIANMRRAKGDLATLPSALRSSVDDWPHAAVVLDPEAIVVSPASPNPGESVTIAIEVKNPGTSDLLGILVNVALADSADGPAFAQRQFIRSIPAGDSVIVKTDARFPRGFGVISVLAGIGADAQFPALLTDSNWSFVAWRIVRPDLAPKGFVDSVGAAIGCKPDCHVR
jgi:hypothetical protein